MLYSGPLSSLSSFGKYLITDFEGTDEAELASQLLWPRIFSLNIFVLMYVCVHCSHGSFHSEFD